MLSLHVLVEPKHHPLQHPWVRRMRSLSPALKRQIGEFSFVYRHFVPSLVAPAPDQELRSFEDELAALVNRDPDTIALDFARPLYDHGGRRDAAVLAQDAVRGQIVRGARALGGSADLASLAVDDPSELARRFAAFLTAYWDEAFADEWKRVEPRLADAVSAAGVRIASGGVYEFLRGVSRQLRIDEEREEFGIDVPHRHRVAVTDERPLLLVPSVYVWPHVHVNCDEPWPLSVVYAVPDITAASRPPVPPGELVRVLRALGDHTRLRALKLIAERPRSTQELAPLVGISEAGLSKHLRQLAEAGVVQTRREGYYVLYTLVPERVEPLSDALRRFLEPG